MDCISKCKPFFNAFDESVIFVGCLVVTPYNYFIEPGCTPQNFHWFRLRPIVDDLDVRV